MQNKCKSNENSNNNSNNNRWLTNNKTNSITPNCTNAAPTNTSTDYPNRTQLPMNNKYYQSLSFKKLTHSSETSIVRRVFVFLSEILLNILCIIPLSALGLLFLPIKLLKLLAFKLFTLTKANNTCELLTPIELVWLHDTKLNRSISSALLILDENLSRNTLRDMITNRILNAHTRSNTKQFARFTQRLAKLSFTFDFYWMDYDEFCLDDHLMELPKEIQSELDLKRHIAHLHSMPVDTRKPLWKLYFGQISGETYILFVYHLSLIDGLSTIRLFFKTLIDNRLIIDVKPRFGHENIKLKLVKNILFGWHRLLYDLFFKKRDVNLLKCTARLTGKKLVTWSEPFSLVELFRLKSITRTTINDLILSVISGIVRVYLQKNGIKHPAHVNCIQTIDLTQNTFPFKIKNCSTLSVLRLASNSEGAVPRLWDLMYTSNKLKTNGCYLSHYVFINFTFHALPHCLARLLCRSLLNMNTLMVSSLAAGSNNYSTISINNKSVKNILYFQPCVANLALSISVITYGDEIRLCLLGDTGLVTSPEFICNEFKAQFEILKELLGHRRIPGEIKKPIRQLPVIQPSVSSILISNDSLNYEETHLRMSSIQSELIKLTREYSALRDHSSHEKSQISSRLDFLRKDFRGMLDRLKYPHHSNNNNNNSFGDDTSLKSSIPSDDEDELEPELRAKLRSSSTKSSLKDNLSQAKSQSRHSSISLAIISTINTQQQLQHQHKNHQVNRSHSTASAEKFKSEI